MGRLRGHHRILVAGPTFVYGIYPSCFRNWIADLRRADSARLSADERHHPHVQQKRPLPWVLVLLLFAFWTALMGADEDLYEQYEGVDRNCTPHLLGDSGRLWRSMQQRIRVKSLAEGATSGEYNGRLIAAVDVIASLERGLHAYDEDRQPRHIWVHRNASQVEGRTKAAGESITRDTLLEAAGKYLATPTLQHPEIDWILIDSLIYAELSAYREAVADGTALGTFNFWYVASGRDFRKALTWGMLGRIVSFVLRHGVQIAVILVAANVGRSGLAAVVSVLYVWYVAGRIVRWFILRRKVRRAITILASMAGAYWHASPPVINPTILRASVDKAVEGGAVFDSALFSLLDRVAARDASTFLPYQESLATSAS